MYRTMTAQHQATVAGAARPGAMRDRQSWNGVCGSLRPAGMTCGHLSQAINGTTNGSATTPKRPSRHPGFPT